MSPETCAGNGVEKECCNEQMWCSKVLASRSSCLLIRPATALVKGKTELLRAAVIGVELRSTFSGFFKLATVAVASPRRRQGSP